MDTAVSDLLNKVRHCRRSNNYADAKDLLKQALSLSKSKNVFTRAAVKAMQAQIERDLNQPEKARQLYEEALKLYQQSEDLLNQAHVLRHMADIERELNQFDIAEEHYNKVLQLYKSMGEISSLPYANALRGYALLMESLLNPEKAKEFWREAKSIYLKNNIREGVEECELHL